MSYVISGKTGAKQFYETAHEADYFQITSETIIEKKLLEALCASFFFQHSTFRSFSEAYNYRFAISTERSKLNYKRLCDIFYGWQLVKYYINFYKVILKSNTFVKIMIRYHFFFIKFIFNV